MVSHWLFKEFNLLFQKILPLKQFRVEVNVLTGETTLLRTDLTYVCGLSMNHVVDLGQIEGAFVQGLGFFMLKEYLADEDGLVVSDSTWTYKVPTLDNIPKQFNVEVLNSKHNKKRVLSCAGRKWLRSIRLRLCYMMC